MTRAATVLLVFSSIFALTVRADQVSLKNGDRLTGTITSSDAKTLVLKTEAAGEVTIQWSAIDAITSTQSLHVGLTGGQMVVGPVTTKGGQIVVATQTAGVVSAPMTAIQLIRSDAAQASYDAAMERLQHPHLGDFWSGTLDTGLSLTRGNSATLSYNLAGRAVRQTDRDKITAYMTAVYGKNDNTSPGQVIAHQITGGVRGDINFSARLFAFAATDFNSNALQNLDLQNVVYGGIGDHLIKTKNTQFDVFGGAGYNQEFFGAYTLPNPTPPPADACLSSRHATERRSQCGRTVRCQARQSLHLQRDLQLFPEPQRSQRLPVYVQFRALDRLLQMARLAIQLA